MARADRPADRPDSPQGANDPTRREFFRTFGRETVRQAGAVAGAAAELRRSSVAAARVLFDPETAVSEVPPATKATVDATFRSAYRFTGDDLVVLDVRELPGRVETVSLREPSEIASAMRVGAINAGPVLAEVGAYAMVLAARAAATRPGIGRHQQMRAAAGTLRAARPAVKALAWAVDRMESRDDKLVEAGADPGAMANALRADADAIASEATEAQAAIGRIGARAIPPPPEGPINLLIHGDMGPLACGMVGMGTALVQALRDAGREVHAWLTDAAPSHEGGRLSAFQMRQLGFPHTVVPDSAVAWLLDNQRIDAVLLRGDRVCANGDAGVLIGGLGAARLAADAGVPIHVLAPLCSIDPAARDGKEIRGLTSLVPGAVHDVIPADLITSFFTESGILPPPYGPAIGRVL